jgi:hypothetical protein
MNRSARWTSPLALLGYAVLWTGLLLSVTRMTIVACLLQVVLLQLLARRPGHVAALGVLGVVLFTALLVVVPGLASFVWETLTWQTGSSASHSKDYVKGLVALWSQPLGSGIGTTDQTAMRLGRDPLTADNYYLKYAVELGVPALLALLTMLGTVLWTALRAAVAGGSASRRAFGAFSAACTVGFLFNGGTAVLTNSPTIAYLFFWIAGSTIAIGHAVSPAGARAASLPPRLEPARGA